MTRTVLAAGVAALLLVGIYRIALDRATRVRTGERGGESAAAYPEPEILLRGVTVRQVRADDRSDRFVARRAVYRVLSKDLSAEEVVFTAGTGAGAVRVEAPKVRWDMREERLDLPEGGTARNGAGWAAEMPDARIDLADRVLRASRAAFFFPGVRVAGTGLVWEWKQGTVALSSPESRLLPAPLRRGIRNGGPS